MVSIITINYNNAAVTCELLKSLQNFNRELFEVIVVDNCSNENARRIKEEYPWIVFVQNERNTGFAGGNNLGIKNAKGDFLFFVNNDTEFNDDIIDKLKSTLINNCLFGIVCPVINYFDQPNRIQYAGYTDINPLTGRNQLVTSIYHNEPYITSYAHGAAMMMKREVYDKVGPMPENYFVYYEELEWSAKVTQQGFYIAVDPSCTIFHKESQTVGRLTEMKSYFLVRNRILFMRRNFKPWCHQLFWFFFLFITTPKQLMKFLFRSEWKNMVAHLAGIWWNISNNKNSLHLGYKFNSIRS